MQVACIRDVGLLSEVRPCLWHLFRWAGSTDTPTGRVLTLTFRRDKALQQRWCWKAGVELFTNEQPAPGIEIEALGAGWLGRMRGSP